jgi:hypothetical protein
MKVYILEARARDSTSIFTEGYYTGRTHIRQGARYAVLGDECDALEYSSIEIAKRVRDRRYENCELYIVELDEEDY